MTNTISVTGRGEASVVPDAAFFDIGVQVLAPTVGAATAQAASRAEAVIAELEHAGVARTDIGTRDYNVFPEYDHRNNRNPPRVVGYRVNNTVTVAVREIANVSQIIDQATAAGGDVIVVQNLRFGAADPSGAESVARAAAWTSAQAKATELAELAGVSVGGVRSIDERVGGGHAPMPRMRAEMAMASAPPIEPGSQSISVQIDVVFEIES